MRRIFYGLALCAMLFALSFPAEAQQQSRLPRIGFVSRDGDLDRPGTRVEAFRSALREIGYTEGKNILVEYRYISGMTGQIERLVTELLQQKVDVLILTPSQRSVRPSRRRRRSLLSW